MLISVCVSDAVDVDAPFSSPYLERFISCLINTVENPCWLFEVLEEVCLRLWYFCIEGSVGNWARYNDRCEFECSPVQGGEKRSTGHERV